LLRGARLLASVVVGAVVGAAYVAFDVFAESRLARGTLTGALADVHWVVDRSTPVVFGVLFGAFVHSWFLRHDLRQAEAAAARAEALRTRLLKVERDQAIWVLAATVLHELNNPLHAVGLLLDEHAAETDEARRLDLIARARGHADRARQHLGLLRSLRGDREPALSAVSLVPEIGALAEEFFALAREEGVVVRTDCDAVVVARADRTFVRTILENLVDNSLAALREGGGRAITIRVQQAPPLAVVSIEDDAPPIDEKLRGEIFEPLRSTKAHGLGLGLPIARALARAMDGDLTLEDGKTFRLSLPLASEVAQADVSPSETPAAGSSTPARAP
jgi:signal transduction histidine kinase